MSRKKVDDLCLNAFLGEFVCCLHAIGHANAERDERDVMACAMNARRRRKKHEN